MSWPCRIDAIQRSPKTPRFIQQPLRFPGAALWTFSAECVVTARTACRLVNDFELESHGLALVLTLLERIRELQTEVKQLHAELPS